MEAGMPRRTLHALLDRYNAAPAAARAKMAAEIERRYGVLRAILVLDMSGFSRTVREQGICHYLGMIRRMEMTTRPLVEALGGTVVKYEADNLFALFPDAASAVSMAVRAREALRAPAADGGPGIEVAIGIAWGRLLHLPGADMFGDVVNIACKLGEDVAAAGDILLDEAARRAVADSGCHALEPVPVRISGIDVVAWRVAA
jgi:class 3 adenylate cyclase